jgi:hypothetical protein
MATLVNKITTDKYNLTVDLSKRTASTTTNKTTGKERSYSIASKIGSSFGGTKMYCESLKKWFSVSVFIAETSAPNEPKGDVI